MTLLINEPTKGSDSQEKKSASTELNVVFFPAFLEL